MNQSDPEQRSAGGAVASDTVNTRLSGSWLIIARVAWLVLVVPSMGLFVISFPAYYQQLQKGCVDQLTCSVSGALPVQVLHSPGFPATGYAALLTIFFVIIEAIWCGVGFLLFWRRSDDWLALLVAFFLVMFNVTSLSGNNSPYALALTYPVFALPFSLVSFLGQVSLGVFFLLFPNGRLVPRWMGLVLLLGILYEFFSNFPSPTSPFNANWPAWLNLLVILVIFGALIFSQIYRYRRVSTPVQRQQTKWVTLGVTAALGVVIGILSLGVFLTTSVNSNLLGAQIIINAIWPIALLLIPLSIGFSIMRYRLYDIDILINRTLVYGSLTALLTLLYFGLVVALQALFQGMFHQNNAVATVVSTLVIAALFQPLRHRLQAIIDHRFYRRKYDAAKTVEAFSATLRNEVDLDQLRDHLLTVVQETMQPAHVSLWLRQPPRKVTPFLQTGKPPSKEAGVRDEIAGKNV
jgi:hypothetical protein